MIIDDTYALAVAGERTSDIFIFDGSKWTLHSPSLITMEHSVAGYVPATHSLVIAGGFSSYATIIQDLTTLEWRSGPTLNGASYHFGNAAVVPYLDTFLIVGGYITDGTYDDRIRMFEPTTETWQTVARLQSGKSFVAAFTVPDEYAACD